MKLRSLHRRLALFSVLAAGAFSLPSLVNAQVVSADDANNAASQLMTDGKLPEAAAAFEDFLKKYPTSTGISDAQYRLATLYFMLGDYDKSRTFIQKTQVPPASPEINELGAALLPQVLAAKASKETAEAARKAGFEEAIKEYDAFLTKYPSSTQVEASTYGRALCSFQISKYDDTAEALRKNLKQFPKSETIQESQFLLGLCLMTQGALTAQETYGKANPKADAAFAESQRLLADIVTRRSDIALLNDAQFQLGELFANQAIFAPKENQEALFAKALEAYRAILPKEDTITAQKNRINAVRDRRLAALRTKNIFQMKSLEGLLEHERTKLAAVEGKADLTVSAQIKIGQLFYQKKAYDEARVVFHQMQPFAEDNDQKKNLLYHLTMSYADQCHVSTIPAPVQQKLISKAVEGYDEFQQTYKGDSIAENLPFAIGSLFIVSNAPEQALRYFQESVQIYPKGRLLDATLAAQANACVSLKRYDEARATFQTFLKGNPKPDLAATAELGIANINKETEKFDEALAGYQKIAATYPGTPQAETAIFWVGQIQLQKGNLDAAIATLSAFLKDHPESTLLPTAQYNLAQAYGSKADTATALRLYKELADKYPDSDAAPYAYLGQCNLLTGPEKAEERATLMREFIRRYPTHEYIFYAYNLIAQDLLAKNQITDAIAAFSEMVEKHPKDKQAPTALFNVAALWNQQASALGRYFAMNDAQKAQWTTALKNSIAACEQVLSDYPESQPVAMALQYLLSDQKLLAMVNLKTDEEITTYFQSLATQFETQPQTRSKVLFTLASFTYEKDKAKALEQMTQAYDPKLIFAPADIDLYGSALLEQGKVDDAVAVYQKLAADFPDPDSAHPEKSPLQVQEAQAIALFGTAKALQSKEQIAEAAAKFETFKRLYPSSAAGKILDANYGIAVLAYREKQYDKALPLLVQVIKSRTGSNELHANAMLLHAKVQEARNEMLPAIDGYLKVPLYYDSVPAAASEGLWRGGQLLEKQAAGLPQTSANPKDATKPMQLRKALKAYQDLQTKFPNTPHVAEAKGRADALAAALK
ncbi:MAG: tetratricopeptide repeat protein [Chthoniobacteraceae bacterium]|nr:tetratricopeptide repeat protein [Chthoniobacteraceae bacterium]